MRLPAPVIHQLWRRLEPITHRCPDEIIGHKNRWRLTRPDGPMVDHPFLLRWFVGGEKHKWGGNIYLHQFIADDDDRALHDHPWWNLSILLGGQYVEHTIDAGGVNRHELFRAGAVKLRAPTAAHRVELTGMGNWSDPISLEALKPILGECPLLAPTTPNWCCPDLSKIPSWSLFMTGPVQRKWGFHCASAWRSNQEFTRLGGCT